jgi:Fe2+ transport system protein FeoA
MRTDVDHNTVKSLDEIPAGATVRIVTVDAGRGLKNRLAAMGLLTNVEIRVLRNDRTGQIIVSVKNSKVILGRGMSHKVSVTDL